MFVSSFVSLRFISALRIYNYCWYAIIRIPFPSACAQAGAYFAIMLKQHTKLSAWAYEEQWQIFNLPKVAAAIRIPTGISPHTSSAMGFRFLGLPLWFWGGVFDG